VHIKRNLGILAVTVGLVAAVAVPSASAKSAPPKTPLNTFPTPAICHTPDGKATHQIDQYQVVGPQKERKTTEPNGDNAVTTSGRLVMKFVNHDTGKALIEDVSGSVKTVTHKDGTVDQIADGRDWWALGPGGQKNTGRPGLFITTGPVALHVAPPTVQSFTQLGDYQLDLCKALGAA
jgi:hypothetical protein